MALNFVEEIVFDWFRLVKNRDGISAFDVPTPRPKGKKGGGHGGDIDILSIGKDTIWIAEVETFSGTKSADIQVEKLKRKFNEKTNFVKQKYAYLDASKNIEKIYVCESPNPKLMNLIKKELSDVKPYYLTEIISTLITEYFDKNPPHSPGPGLSSSVRTLYTLNMLCKCINKDILTKYNTKIWQKTKKQ